MYEVIYTIIIVFEPKVVSQSSYHTLDAAKYSGSARSRIRRQTIRITQSTSRRRQGRIWDFSYVSQNFYDVIDDVTRDVINDMIYIFPRSMRYCIKLKMLKM